MVRDLTVAKEVTVGFERVELNFGIDNLLS